MWKWLKRKTLSTIVEERLKQAYKDLIDAEDAQDVAELNVELYGRKVTRLEGHREGVTALERKRQAPTLHDVVASPPAELGSRGRSVTG